MEKRMSKVAEQRKRILDWTEDTESAVLKKRDFLAAADSAAASLKTTGDLVIAAFFAGDKPKQRQQNRDEYLHRHLELQKGENIAQNLPWQLHTLNRLKGISSSSSSSSPNSKSNIQNSKSSPPIRSFHWEIEFPEVFSRKNPGFDAFVGNPPFLGGNKISEYFVGPEYGHWLKSEISESKGQVDLCVFFFCRTFALLRDDGTMGLIATSGLAEGDSRVAGLGAITARGGRIYAAKNAVPWPGTAAVLVCQIHIYKGNSQGITCQLNLTICDHINSRLQPRQELPNAVPLTSNSGWCFKGTSPGGDGFVLSLEEVKSLVEKDQRNAVVIKPLVGGDEVTAAPRDQANRRIITFGKMSLQEAEQWPAVLDIVRERILPQRLKGKNHGPGLHGRKYWWQHVLRADPLYRAIESINQCLVISEVSTHHAVRFDNTSSIFLKTVYVFAWDSFCAFSILQSRLHEIWSREHSSKLGAASRYSVSNAFETFPFPEDWETNAALEEVGRTYYEYRAALMVRNNEGLTKTYNRFHDPEETKKNSPDIHQLRELHASMDRAVLDAYGWTDIPTACEFLLDYEEEDSEDEAIETAGKKKRQKKKPWRYRWPDEVRDEVLAKLLALNAECAEQERLAGSGKKPSKTITTTRTGALKQSAMQRPKAEDELL
jgi:hypothetical protein